MQQLQTLIETLESQDRRKKDYLSPSSTLMFLDGKLQMVHAGQTVSFTPTDHFHAQTAEKLSIPKGYYDRMRQKALHLLDDNVNHWLKDDAKNLLIRTFDAEPGGDNVARAVLSDRYNMIDNYEVLLETLDAIRSTGMNVEIPGAELSETRMFLHITCPDIEIQATEMLKNYRRTIEVGSGIISGFVLQNCEIGGYAFQIAPRAVILACNNGMVMKKDGLRLIHLGGKLDDLGMGSNERIKNANRKLVKEQVAHAVKHFLSKDYLQNLVNQYTLLGNKEIPAPILNNVVEVVAKEYSISEERKANILNFFIKGGDTRRIGLVNAITEEVQTLTDADLRNDSEAMTFDMLESFDSIEAKAIKMQQSAN